MVQDPDLQANADVGATRKYRRESVNSLHERQSEARPNQSSGAYVTTTGQDAAMMCGLDDRVQVFWRSKRLDDMYERPGHEAYEEQKGKCSCTIRSALEAPSCAPNWL